MKQPRTPGAAKSRHLAPPHEYRLSMTPRNRAPARRVTDLQEHWRRPFPRVVRIEPASACNLACSHCPTGTVDMVRGTLRWDTFQAVLQSISRHRDAVRVVVLYHGGEPLLNKKLFDMVRAIKQASNAMVKTVSNGMVMTERIASDFVASGLDAVEFSIDGQSAHENDRVRRGARYSKVVSNIRLLISAKEAAGSVLPRVFLSTTQFLNRNTPLSTQEPTAPEFLKREFAAEIATGRICDIKATFAMRWPHMTVLDDQYDVHFDPEDKEIRTECDHVLNTVSIRSNGDVVPCCYDLTSRSVMGNVHKEELEAIWNNSSYLALRQGISEGRFISLCENCNVVKPKAYLVPKAESQ